jgi:hypothetical protein
MAQTLSGYITQVRYLLHDANANFYSNSQLTNYINEARGRVSRDTGCLRTLQQSYTPIAPTAGNPQPVSWQANLAVTVGQYFFSNIFIYVVTTAGTFGTQAPQYPSGNGALPPTAPFQNGTAYIQYVGRAEIIPYASLPNGLNTLDVLNVNLFWGNSRYPLRYLPWTQFNAQLRYWQNYIGRPIAFTIYGQSQIVISPVPDQQYLIEVDTTLLPTDMIVLADEDTIISPYSNLVQFYAAYMAKYYEQSFGEAEIFKQEYIKHAQSVLNTTFTRRIPDPYATPW